MFVKILSILVMARYAAGSDGVTCAKNTCYREGAPMGTSHLRRYVGSVAALAVVTAIVISQLWPQGAAAQPAPFPTLFTGNVTIDGSAAPNGTTVSVQVNGSQCASGTTSSGTYNFVGTCPAGTGQMFVGSTGTQPTFTLTPGQTYTFTLAVTSQGLTPTPTATATATPGTPTPTATTAPPAATPTSPSGAATPPPPPPPGGPVVTTTQAPGGPPPPTVAPGPPVGGLFQDHDNGLPMLLVGLVVLLAGGLLAGPAYVVVRKRR